MSIEINSAWDLLKSQIEACKKCDLCETRTNVVIGEGPTENCKCVIIGEAPGEDEDLSGHPFVGRAGQLLTKILENGGGIKRDSLYVTNTVKCRPPGNKEPNTGQLTACSDFLEAQLLLLQPSVIVTLGNISTKWLLKTSAGITSIRGQWQKWRKIDLLPMFHPSYLLRQTGDAERKAKQLTWNDVKSLKAKLDELNNKE
ncbi:MAG: uracil-DNA glycosylase [Synergistaceae bacterium]|nr:uracil-DNA glycosylase [Synergistaceae bacterium]MBR0204389.1 uracil-DNA glycosylase [Synergistaceae bacterium]